MNTLLKTIAVATLLMTMASTAQASTCNVQKGESLWKIAQEYHLDFSRLLELNKHLKNRHLIYPRQKVNTHVDSGTGNDHNESTNAETQNPNTGNATQAETNASQSQAAQVLQLVNKERTSRGLKALALDSKLNEVATEKARDMAVNRYFSHDSPTYGSPFDMMKSFGINYRSAGENIAAGQKDAQAVMDSWMNSSGHRANILNANYTKLGVGYYKGGNYGTYWVQEFTQ